MMQGAHSSACGDAFAFARAASHCARGASVNAGIARTVSDTLNRPWFGQSNPFARPVLGSEDDRLVAGAAELGGSVGDRSLKSARKGGRVNNVMVVSSCARGRRPGQRIRSAAPARSYRVGRGTTRSNPLAEGGCGVCALWHFRLGDRLLIGGCAGAERRAAIEGKQGDC